ncbi:M48 family metallopeptidase [Portibacter marinus]|uniref:M48 family metallopeptidase n=1 Tax=Portibacter marinus TaxID=2898660 RepID=UPI001F3C42C3|nr:M48 family metallopeptidase [Portibacter marinus]
MNFQNLENIDISDFQHPKEAQSMKRLRETKGFERVVRKFYDLGIENIIKLQFTGSSLKLSPKSFPELYQLTERACQILGVDHIPDIYVHKSDEFTARTLGVDNPMIAISTECVDKLSKEELLFVIGREVAKIKCQHILYQEIGFIFPELMDAVSPLTLGLSGVLSSGLKYALFHWSQMAEYTADRGGLLVCQDVYAIKKLYAKLAGLPERYWATFDVGELEEQAKAFEGFKERTFDKFMRFLYGNNLWAIARAQELVNWIETGGYNRVLVSKAVN